MVSVEQPIGHNLVLHRAFAERVVWQTVGIVNTVADKAESATEITYRDAIGTGSACRWKGRDIILTAKHVVERAGASDLRFFLRPTGQLTDWSSRSGPQPVTGRIRLTIDSILESRKDDLAAIVLGADRSERPSLQYCELADSFAEVPPSGSGVFLAGYPSDLAISIARFKVSDRLTRHALATFGNACWTTIVSEPPSFFPSSYDPELHFLLQFDPDQEGSMPYGYSGTGVWYQGKVPSELWSALPILAGVQIQWHAKSKLMIALRSSVVKQFLEESLV
jgi:hypothetical protein